MNKALAAAVFSIAGLTMSGCASVDIEPLNPDRSAASGPSGAQYYLPKPYLMVTLLPPATEDGGGPNTDSPPPLSPNRGPGSGDPNKPKPGAAPGKDEKPGKDDKPEQDTPEPGTEDDGGEALPPSSGSDTNFEVGTSEYKVKIVYLPDLQHPMAINVSSGLMGTVEFSPTLQSGWMLTSYKARAENNMAELIKAITPLISPLLGGAGAGTGEPPKPGSGPDAAAERRVSGQVLRPGLYAFDYDDVTGKLMRLCAVTYFSAAGVVPGNCYHEAPILTPPRGR